MEKKIEKNKSENSVRFWDVAHEIKIILLGIKFYVYKTIKFGYGKLRNTVA